MRTSKALQDELRKASQKASWESQNEGVHERVSFDDTIWGFNLAGGSYYKTPLRVTSVKQDSRAHNAGIKPGDLLLRINDIDSSTLSIQEAHDIILESGIHIRLAVSAPEDQCTSYSVWQDEYEEFEEESKIKQVKKEIKVHKEFKGAKTVSVAAELPLDTANFTTRSEVTCQLKGGQIVDKVLKEKTQEKEIVMQPKTSNLE